MKNRNYEKTVSIVISLCLAVLTFLYAGGFSQPVIYVLGAALGCFEKGAAASVVLTSANANEKNEIISGFAGSRVPEQGEKQTAEDDLTVIPDDIKKLMSDAEALYAGFEKTGSISEKQLGGSSLTLRYGRVSVDDKTDEHKPDIKALLEKKPSFGNITKDEPYILVYHTHTTEGYELLDKGFYSSEYNSRTEDGSKTVVRVGDALCAQLEKAGFKVIHDRTVYDANYNGAYSRSLVTVEKYLKKYPSIVLTLDVHRDAIQYDSGTKCKPTAVIDGKKAAQVMIISGCEEGDITDFPSWQQNLVFALALHNAVEERAEGLMRPVFFCRRKYNMNVTPCSLLLEFGTDANTLDEAVYSSALVGRALGALLNKSLNEK